MLPRFTVNASHQADPESRELTGDYYHSKQIYREAIGGYLYAKIPEVPADRLQAIEKYMVEMLALGQGKLDDVQRFAVTFPFVDKADPLVQTGLRTITLGFERKKGTDVGENKDRNVRQEGGAKQEKAVLTIYRCVYESKINKKLFDSQELNQKVLDQGKPVVQRWIRDVLV
ncbi:uncharacterized protein N7446_005603 [Penicillium canescens]|uniref:uncharacterized protein n=1 Tax=Penicillium canescens TaxID=5083 RepID=UPI0026E0D54C|nr:uncharacterized protein N7446_005603 [Penicillium canescens]KAJ6061483.1 hypothetical protein N7446_005603 [Penicillium canescens]